MRRPFPAAATRRGAGAGSPPATPSPREVASVYRSTIYRSALSENIRRVTTAPDTAAVIQVAKFRAALRSFLRESERVARRNSLTPQRYLLLLMIKGAPDETEQATVTDLADRLKLAQSSVTELVNRAQAAGLVHRETSMQDGRVAHLRLTEEGERRLAQTFTGLADERRQLRSAFAEFDR
jgi:DNA-binding MarR family transcriptional regulator